MNAHCAFIFFYFRRKNLSMKNLLFAAVILCLFSCTKSNSGEVSENKTDSVKIIDSINQVRLKINDSIRNRNKFSLLTGNHTITHSMVNGSGKVSFVKVKDNNDEYEIDGLVQSGKNYFKLKGYALRLSDKYFNFTGEYSQSIQDYNGGKVESYKTTKSFLSKDGGKTWKMQGAVNKAGFLDDIFIKIK